MPLPLDAGQAALASRPGVAPVLLLELKTFTDYTAATVEATYYWTLGGAVRFPWAGADRDFDPVVARCDPISQAITHPPDAGVADTRTQALRLVLSNRQRRDGGSLWSELRGRNLAFAKLTAALVLVDPRRRSGLVYEQLIIPPDLVQVSPTDLTDYTGSEPRFWFRGELTAVGDVTDTEIPLTFETIEPELSWPRCPDVPEADPRDVGRRYPVPVGRARQVAAINREVGSRATLAEGITAATTGNVAYTDPDGRVPTGSQTFQLGAERITATKVDAVTLNITARGVGSTTAAPHKAGAALILTRDTKLVVGGFECNAVNALYVVSPFTRELTEVDSALYSVALANTTLDTGRTLSVVTLTQANLEALFDALAAAAAVDTQPEFESLAGETVRAPLSAISSRDPALNPDGIAGPDESELVLILDAPLGGRLHFGDGGTEGLLLWVPTGSAPSPTRAVSRFRVVAKVNYEDHFARDFLIVLNYDFFGLNGSATLNVATGSGLVLGGTIVGPWETPGGGNTVDDLERSAAPTASTDPDFLSVYLNYAGTGNTGDASNFAFVYAIDSYVEVELAPEALTRTTDTAVSGPSLAAGLQFVADVDGVELGGVLAVSAPDVIEWVISVLAGLGSGAIDAASFAAAEAGGEGDPIEALDTAAEWTGSPADDTTISTDGSSIRWDLASSAAFLVTDVGVSGISPSLDFTAEGAGLRFFFRLDVDPSTFGGVDELNVLLLTQGVTGTHFYAWGALSNAQLKALSADTWYEIVLLLADASTQGTPDPADVTGIVLSGFSMPAAGSVWVDQVEQLSGSPGLAGDLRTAGESFGDLLARLGYESGLNLTRRETSSATTYRLLGPNSDYSYPTSLGALPVFDETESRPLALEAATRFTLLYQLAPWLGLDLSAFRGALRIADGDNAISPTLDTELGAAEDRRGPREAALSSFRLVRDPATAGRVFGFYCHEALRDPSRFAGKVPWSDGYALEPGDVRSIVPVGGGAAVKARVLQVSFQPSEPLLGVLAVEVD